MGIPFDHVQMALDAPMIIGTIPSSGRIYPPGVYTEEEVWRSWIDAGFSGVFSFMEARLSFKCASAGITIDWKWQIRPKGQTVWTDLHPAVTSTIGGILAYPQRVIFDAVAPAAEGIPFELRLVFSNTVEGGECNFTFYPSAADGTSLRVVGESL